MSKPISNIFIYIFLLASISVHCQSISSRVVDTKTNEGIPYATVQFSEHRGIITNEEGRFSVNLKSRSEQQDSIYISSMGYKKTAIHFKAILDSVIYIEPKAIELNEVYLFNNNLSIDEIIEKVKENLPTNYNKEPIKQRLFFRQSSLNTMTKMDIEFEKSTIEELNKKFLDSVVSILPRNASYYTESLCDFYRKPDEHRLYIEKAAELYDKNNKGSMEALSAKLERIFKENVKPDSYLKIKSGWFGQKVELDSLFDASDETDELEDKLKDDGNKHFLSSKKDQLHDLYSELFYNDDTKLNFINKSNRYEFRLKGFTALEDEGVYVIEFDPKRSEDFRGTIYVNIEDFAIMRIDYENVNSLKRIKLLGFSYEEITYKGTTIFSKGSNNKYDLRFIDKVFGRKMGIRRPLSVIEKNKHVKGRRKQNELSMELDIINFNTEKYELVVFDSKLISTGEFSNSVENETVKATYLSSYNPEFWEGYDIMEPNRAIREFTVSAK
ncbi:carboxypeptidase-like regulatory domain-containing protein [uncultured Eudoraea sp.]|uniref:carboxypeptidase-like regulatory domain-containing protein n=1 Tax=uncultured Eudoraea sp. TaxID=1035614 RepID=UPI00260BE2BD|nr:carboxypeptidase-like regulatory domain-containing protein [uncultured Eudoraea sp.]